MRKCLGFILFFIYLSPAVFGDAPDLQCSSLIGCGDNSEPIRIVGVFIEELIKYTALVAVIAVMISGIYYLISSGDEEKVKKGKKGIIWSIIGVILSVSAWFIIQSINKLTL